MVEEAINKTYEYILALLEQRRLKEAIAQLQMQLNSCDDWRLRSSLEEISTSYRYMLQYMIKGVDDPKCKELYNNLVIRLWETADQIHEILLDMVSPRLYHIIRNTASRDLTTKDLMRTVKKLESAALDMSVNSLLPDDTRMRQTSAEIYKQEKELFTSLWTNIYWTGEDIEAAHYLLESSAISRGDQCLAVGGVTMSLLECFDINKLMWLFDVYSTASSPRIRQRAVVGIFLVMHVHAAKMSFYPIVSRRLSLLKESTNIARDFTQCYINFVNCWETTKINRIMTEEIVPGILRDMNAQRNDTEKKGDDDDPNTLFPHIENKELESKLERLTRMSMEGGDLYMSTFQNLKGFAFFHDIENWFKPFDMNQPQVMQVLSNSNEMASTILNILKGAAYLCDNDKYSLAHLLPKMPLNQFNMMKAQLEQAEEAMKEEDDKDELMTEDEKVYKLENSNYMHDLYRFFKVSPRKNEFTDVFGINIFGIQLPDIDQMIYDSDNLILLAEFLLKKKYWEEAGNLFDKLITLNTDDSRNGALYCRRGYTLQRQKLYGEALSFYQRAEIFLSSDKWLSQQIAVCYRMTGLYDKALKYYRQLVEQSPDDLQLNYHTAICLAEAGDYEEAFRHLFKVDFLQPDSLKVWRAIAWYSFVAGKMDQARKYYEKIIDKGPAAADYINLGHIDWLEGKMSDAVTDYRNALSLCKDCSEFTALFAKDKNILLAKGIDADSLPLMMDCVL